jgi:hypothetical protein
MSGPPSAPPLLRRCGGDGIAFGAVVGATVAVAAAVAVAVVVAAVVGVVLVPNILLNVGNFVMQRFSG